MKAGIKKTFRMILCTLQLVAFASAATAAPLVVKTEEALRAAFPGLTFESVSETDIKGMYEVISGSNIFYYFPEKDYIIVGEIYNKERKSLTAEKKREMASRLFSTLPLEKAVKVGAGKKMMVEVTDPDCPYCKKASESLGKRDDITRYVFFAPLAHPAAIEKIHYILSAPDKAKAYSDIMEGKVTPPSGVAYSDSVKALAQEHLALARMVGVQGTPSFFINGKLVTGADMPQIEKLLGEMKTDEKK